MDGVKEAQANEQYVGCTVTFEKYCTRNVLPRPYEWTFRVERKGCLVTSSAGHFTRKRCMQWFKETTGLPIHIPTRSHGRGYVYEVAGDPPRCLRSRHKTALNDLNKNGEKS